MQVRSACSRAKLQCSRVGVTGMKFSNQMWESFIIPEIIYIISGNTVLGTDG